MPNALQIAAHGRVSILSEDVISKIISNLAVGNYVKPSVEAVGIHYSTFRYWMQQGEADLAAGKQTPHALLVERVARAQAEAETSLAGRLHASDDWRAQSFLLERGPGRARWGKDEQAKPTQVVIQIPDALAGVLADALRVGARQLEQAQVIDAESESLPSQALPSADTKNG